MLKLIDCYHFCTKEFIKELMEKGSIFPDKRYSEYRKVSYDYLYSKINNGNPLFFSWANESNKGDDINYIESSNYILIHLLVPEEYVIKTSYYDWSDIIYLFDLSNCDTLSEESIKKADTLAKEEFKCVDGLNTVFNSIFDIKNADSFIGQNLLKKIEYAWIKSIKYVDKKII